MRKTLRVTPRLQILLLIVVPAVVLAVIAVVYLANHSSRSFSSVAAKCNNDTTKAEAAVADGGKTLIVQHVGDSATSTSLCVLNELEAPTSVIAKISETSQIQGQVHDSWKGYSVTWTYQPDNGVEIIVEK